MSNLESQIARMHQRIQELEARVDMLLDQRVLASGSGPIDISAAVRDSNGRVGSLADLFYVDSGGILRSKVNGVDLFRITGGTSGNWTIMRATADDGAYGEEYTGVTVATGGNDDGLQLTTTVPVAFIPATTTDPTLVPKILNNYYIKTA